MPLSRSSSKAGASTDRMLNPPWRRLVLWLLVIASTILIAATLRTHLLEALGLAKGPDIHVGTIPVLSFSDRGTFKISIFEDLHFGEDESSSWAIHADKQTLRVMEYLLEAEHPDFVVLNGDLVTGDNTFIENSTDYIDMLVSPLVKTATPWASTYGNHDINFNSSTSAFLHRERNYRLSHTDQMVLDTKAGTSNYYLSVYPSPSSKTPALILYFFDSQGRHAFQQVNADGHLIDIPPRVDASVVAWFRTTSQVLAKKHGRHIPSLAFVHIPASHMASFSSSPEGQDPYKQPGLHGEPDFDPQTSDSAFVRALVDTQNLLAVFSGHQHGNDWCMSTRRVQQDRPRMSPLFSCFGRHTGYGGYGNWERGARQVVLDLQALESTKALEVETWVRLERGDVSAHVVLNATYGMDEYSRVKQSFTHLDDDGNVVDGDKNETGGNQKIIRVG